MTDAWASYPRPYKYRSLLKKSIQRGAANGETEIGRTALGRRYTSDRAVGHSFQDHIVWRGAHSRGLSPNDGCNRMQKVTSTITEHAIIESPLEHTLSHGMQSANLEDRRQHVVTQGKSSLLWMNCPEACSGAQRVQTLRPLRARSSTIRWLMR